MTTIIDVDNLFSWLIRDVWAAGCFVGAHGEILRLVLKIIYPVEVLLI